MPLHAYGLDFDVDRQPFIGNPSKWAFEDFGDAG